MQALQTHRPKSCCAFVALALATLAAGCSATVSQRPAVSEQSDERGFVITEEVRVGADVRADYEQALRLLEQERLDEGIALLQRVAERAPDATSAHIDLGIAYRKSGDLQRAEASIKHALKTNPRHPVAHNELGMLYRRTGRFEEARMHYRQALAVYPGFHYARRNLAVLCDIYLADLKCALENYLLYTAAVPGDAEVAMWVADLRMRTGTGE